MERDGATSLRLQSPYDTSGPESRLAELVAHLTGCAPDLAVEAVEGAAHTADQAAAGSGRDRLAVVAEAMVRLRHDPRVDLRDRRPA